MASARNTTKHADADAQRRSELAKQMRTAPSKEARSKAARELSHSRSSSNKSASGKSGSHSGRS